MVAGDHPAARMGSDRSGDIAGKPLPGNGSLSYQA
jgi:hypothetical protein